MGKLEILDCTLRDGGYYNNWDFDDNLVDHYLEAVNNLPIDYVEIGYRSNEIDGYFGEYFFTSVKLIKSISDKLVTAKLALMIDVKNTAEADLDSLFSSITDYCDLVRMAVAPGKLDEALSISAKLKSMGYKTALNLMYMSNVDLNDEFIAKLSSNVQHFDYLYFVDSFGGMTPDQTNKVFTKGKEIPTNIGFHGHNNMELALANTIEAINCGANIVDATITGMGRGAGNLKTELLFAYLQSKNVVDANLNKLSEVVKQFEELKKEYNWGTNLPYMLSGAYNLPQKDVMEWLGTNRYTVNTIVHSLLNEASNEDYKELKPEGYSHVKKLYIVGGGPKLQKSIDGLKSIIQNDKDALLYHSSSRYANGLLDVSNQSLIGLSGSESDKLIERMGVDNLSKFDYLLAASPRKMNTSLHDSITERVVELPFNKSSIGDSPLGMGLDLAGELNINEIYLIGFDGYDFPNKVQLSLMNENQNAIDTFVNQGGQIISLSSTTYTNLIRKSIYSKLS